MILIMAVFKGGARECGLKLGKMNGGEKAEMVSVRYLKPKREVWASRK